MRPERRHISPPKPSCFSPRSQRRRCCSCVTKKCCVLTWAILLPILATLIVLAIIFWPKMPHVEVLGVQLASSSKPSSFLHSANTNGSNPLRFDRLKKTVFASTLVRIRVNNTNRYDLHIKKIDLKVFYKNVSVGDGMGEKYSFGKRSSENDKIPLNLRVGKAFLNGDEMSEAEENGDGGLGEDLMRACKILPSTSEEEDTRLEFRYEAKIHINPLDGLKIRPSIKGVFLVGCPLTKEEISQLINVILGSS